VTTPVLVALMARLRQPETEWLVDMHPSQN